MRKRSTTRLVDRTIIAYVEWREACLVVHEAYDSWARASRTSSRVAFWGYIAALDAEERASEVYAGLVRGVGRLTANGADRSGPFAA